MRILYLDCFSGASGDLIVGALLDAGAGFEALIEGIGKLDLVPMPAISLSKKVSKGIAASKFEVHEEEDPYSHHHQRHHHHHHRSLSHITALIGEAELSQFVKETSIRIFNLLGEAEASVHGCPVEEVHFHEVGAVDAIVDIVGTAICLDQLGIDKVIVSSLPTFSGTVQCAHGELPLPAPATLKLMKGMPLRPCGLEKELVTPTGAAIIAGIAHSFGPLPSFTIGAIGHGAGSYELPFPNVLRAVVGEEGGKQAESEVCVIETNIDDMNPQYFERVFEQLLELGALDVFVIPVHMKKSRPGFLLQVLCGEKDVEALSHAVFRETTTLGVRIHRAERKCLDRAHKVVSTDYGEIRIKIASEKGEVLNAQAEFADCLEAAGKSNAAVKEVHDAAMAVYWSAESNRLLKK